MLDTASELRDAVGTALPLLESISDAKASVRPAPGKWSVKEIIGHLIDSAGNNQQKFVRAMTASGTSFIGYEQDEWIESQKYNDEDWRGLISLWQAFNIHLAHVIEHAAPALLDNSLTLNNTRSYSLRFLMEDYVEHLKHHLRQIFPEQDKFQNTYDK